MTDHIPCPLLPVQERIWDMKYRLKEADGTPIDVTIEDTWMRVATALAAVEDDVKSWRKDFYAALEDFKFIPAGRIIAGAGADRRVTLFNCFVMGRIGDSIDSIFDNLKEAALTMQQGGGIGYDFSTLRPAGALVKSVAADASGPLPFMDTWDAMCRTIMSAGSRRGAMMGCLRCDHPDIEAFIEAKRNAARFRMFNLSVLVTDDFMAAVKAGDPWDLVFEGKVYGTVDARELWRKILQATYDVADPGVIFIDRMNRANNLAYCEEMFATNPCGEQPLPPYGACDLGSINLAALVRKPFTADAHIDLENLRDLVKIAVRMLDNVIDVSNYPLEAQQDEARKKRRIGLGVTGLANALFMCGKRYAGKEAKEVVDGWMTVFRDTAYLTSVELAREKGPFPLYDAEGFARSKTVQRLPRTIRTAIAESGIRNGLLTSIAPTGTISLLAGNISSGVEPVFAASILRKVLMPDGTHEESNIIDYGFHRYREAYPDGRSITTDFVTVDDLAPTEHLTMQAQMQSYIDSAISKTINCPQDIDFDDFRNVYSTAYELGCKGLHHLSTQPDDRLSSGSGGCRPRKDRSAALECLPNRAAGGGGRQHLQAALAALRPRDLRHDQRHVRRRPAAADRDIHQLEKHGALRLDCGIHSDGVCGVPQRRRCFFRGRGAQGGLRPARRRIPGRQACAVGSGRDRRPHRAPPAEDRAAGGG